MSSTFRPIPGQRVSESLTQRPTREGSPSPLRASVPLWGCGGRARSLRGSLEPRSGPFETQLGLFSPWAWLFPAPSLPLWSRRGVHWLWGVLSDPLLHQDLVFDLGDPVRWEYLLLGTDKPFLSLTEEEDEGMNDDDDVENLVSLHGVGGLDTLSCFWPA